MKQKDIYRLKKEACNFLYNKGIGVETVQTKNNIVTVEVFLAEFYNHHGIIRDRKKGFPYKVLLESVRGDNGNEVEVLACAYGRFWGTHTMNGSRYFITMHKSHIKPMSEKPLMFLEWLNKKRVSAYNPTEAFLQTMHSEYQEYLDAFGKISRNETNTAEGYLLEEGVSRTLRIPKTDGGSLYLSELLTEFSALQNKAFEREEIFPYKAMCISVDGDNDGEVEVVGQAYENFWVTWLNNGSRMFSTMSASEIKPIPEEYLGFDDLHCLYKAVIFENGAEVEVNVVADDGDLVLIKRVGVASHCDIFKKELIKPICNELLSFRVWLKKNYPSIYGGHKLSYNQVVSIQEQYQTYLSIFKK